LASIGMASIFLLLTLLHIILVQRSSSVAAVDDIVEFCPAAAAAAAARGGAAAASICNPAGTREKGAWLIARVALAFVMVECVVTLEEVRVEGGWLMW
jgi:hypothetical protein